MGSEPTIQINTAEVLLERVRQLERRQQLMVRIGLFIAIFLLVGALGILFLKRPSRIIEVDKITLAGLGGTPRMEFEVTPDQMARVQLNDPTGKPRLTFAAVGQDGAIAIGESLLLTSLESGQLVFMDKATKENRMMLKLTPTGSPAIVLWGKGQKSQLEIQTNDVNDQFIRIYDDNGKPRVILGIARTGLSKLSAGVIICDENGNSIRTLP